MGEIAYQNKDVASKAAGEALVGNSLAPFGLPHLEIVGLLPTNLPVLESNELRLDNLFLLSDGSVAIIDYESEFDKKNFVKYINYIARVIRRYALSDKLKDLEKIKMVVIYTADVEQAEECYDLGGLIMNVEAAYLIHLDTNEIYKKLSRKIRHGDMLDEEEVIQLMILPLTVKGAIDKQKAVVKTVELAKEICDRDTAFRIMAGILTFTDKVIDQVYREKIKEEMQMTQIERMMFQDGLEQGMKAFVQDYVEDGLDRETILEKLVKRFQLTREQAEEYFNRFAVTIHT